MKTKDKSDSRRKFFKHLAIMGWAGALATLGGKVKTDRLTPAAVPEPTDSTSQGYRETAHVRKYYEKASS